MRVSAIEKMRPAVRGGVRRGKMAPSRPDLTAVRRAVGVAAVSFLLSGAVVYGLAPDVPTSGPSADMTAIASASPAPTTDAATSETPGGPSSGADPSPSSESEQPTSTPTHGAGDSGGSGSAEPQTIQVEAPAAPAMLFETVRIQGTYHGGADTFLRVQRWERHRWLAFPLPTKTDQSGRFTAFVELGEPGLYWLRVLDPDSGVTSKPFLLTIKG
jgi:hypothetical protein